MNGCKRAYEDSYIKVYSGVRNVVINGSECWKVVEAVFSDEYVDVFESLDEEEEESVQVPELVYSDKFIDVFASVEEDCFGSQANDGRNVVVDCFNGIIFEKGSPTVLLAKGRSMEKCSKKSKLKDVQSEILQFGSSRQVSSVHLHEIENLVTLDVEPLHGVIEEEYDQQPLPAKSQDKKLKIDVNGTRKCSAYFCGNHSGTFSMFSFPQIFKKGKLDCFNLNRCKQWIQNSGNQELLEVVTSKLHTNRWLCSDHFTESNFYPSKKRLLPDAVPSIFTHGKKLSPENMERYPNLSVNEIVMLGNEGQCQDDLFVKEFEKKIESLSIKTCMTCNESYLGYPGENSCIHKGKCKDIFSSFNNMDPGPVPKELSELTFLEEQIIARVHSMVSVYKVKGQQYKYKGNVINYPQNVGDVAKILPHRIEDLPSVIIFRTVHEQKPVDFHVRSTKVSNALLWLKANNRFYKDVEICSQRLDELPEDGNMYDLIKKIDDDNALDDGKVQVEGNGDNDDEEGLDIQEYIEKSFVPNITIPSQDECIGNVFKYPAIDCNPVNEYATDGYIAMAYPTLFPTGDADLRDKTRKIQVTERNWARHMLRYYDGRFARHPTFPFLIMNSIIRWEAIADGSIYISKKSHLKDRTIADLKKMIVEDPSIINQLMFQGKSITSTRPYWQTRQKELKCMSEQVGLGTMFVTLSAADYHWPDLYRILAMGDCPTEQERLKYVRENPLLVDTFFSKRVEAFFEKVLIPKYNVVDYWYRYEYQWRGSPHIHGILWLKNSPDVSKIKDTQDSIALDAVQFFDKLVCTVHPGIDTPPSIEHPCRKKYGNVEDQHTDLCELINKVQIHSKCSVGYCIKGKKKECRFGFPQELRGKTEFAFDDKNNLELMTKRNHPRVNRYNPFILQSWRANMDIAAIVSKSRLIAYLVKYIAKGESKSESYRELLQSVMASFKDTDSLKKAVQRALIKLASERDYGAQEVMHNIMGLKYYSCSRNFCHVYLNKLNNKTIYDTSNRKGLIEKYHSRLVLKEKSLWEVVKSFELPSGAPKKKQDVVIVYPQLVWKEGLEDNDDYFKFNVILHVPHNHLSDFDEEFVSWKHLYEIHNVGNVVISKNYQQEIDDCILEVDQENVEEQGVEDYIEDGLQQFMRHEWMNLAAMGPAQIAEECELGNREIDTNHNWLESCEKYLQFGTKEVLETFIERAKAIHMQCSDLDENENSIQLTPTQGKVINVLDTQINALKNGGILQEQVVKRIIIQGKAGTGKSLIISHIIDRLKKEFGSESYLLVAPTGVAAMNISGSTIHSQLHINTKGDYKRLSGKNGRKFEKKMENVQFLIVDEYSMIGTNLLTRINQRCKDGKKNSVEDFGGLYVYFFGDIQQLPPTMDCAVYNKNSHSEGFDDGQSVFVNFEKILVLDEVLRQQDPLFLNVLNRLSIGASTLEDYDVLATRFTSSVNSEEEKMFEKEMHLFANKKNAKDLNEQRLRNLKDEGNISVPVAKIEAKHNCNTASSGSEDDACGLSRTIYLAKGAKVMLKNNLWTEKGLVNGSQGVVEDILYDKDDESSPFVVICRFDCYRGPGLNSQMNKLVPIPKITKMWQASDGTQCSRMQFPLQLAFALTIHKSQGLTLEKVVIDIGKSDFSAGLTYVALSRCKSLSGILLAPFSWTRFQKAFRLHAIQVRTKFMEDFVSVKGL